MENKHVFAAYANLAVGYLLNSLNGIAAKLNTGLREEEWRPEKIPAFIDSIFDNSKPVNDLEKIVEGNLPWIKPILEKVGISNSSRQADELNDAYKAILLAFCLQLDEVRNFYTHYIHEPIKYYQIELSDGNKNSIPWCITQIYDGALNLIKERFQAEENEIEHLRRYKRKGRKVVLKTPDDKFFYTLNEGNTFTDVGIAFFISLFLNRKYGYLFLKQLSGFKRGETRQYRFTLEVFTALTTKPPVERLRYEENDKLNYAMDILNEISKIPIELYDTLDPAYKKAYNEALDPLAETDDLFDLPERSRIRFRSRFEPLSLRYLDEHPDFKEIGFYTYLGNYFHKGYSKITIDNVQYNRFINFQLAGFCKNIGVGLSDELLQKLKIKSLDVSAGELPDINNFEPYLVEATPHYIVNGNKIGIKILPDGKNCFPTITEKGAKMPVPDYWLSKYELPAMLFYAYLRTSSKLSRHCPLSVREILEKYTLRQVSESSSEDKSELMLRRVEKAIYWCDTKLNEIERIREQSAAFGKKRHEVLRAGKIAEVLARDMIWLQPSYADGKDKVTGSNFQALQRSIAYYGRTKEHLKDIFIRAGLINSKNPHPFLNEVDPKKFLSLNSFYIAYLKRRKTYFEQQKKKLIIGKKNIQCYPLRDLQCESSKKELTNVPLFLPRGLFNEVIIECLKKSELRNSTCFKSPRGAQPVLNVAYLIQTYFKEIFQDQVSDFYTQPRNYHLFDKLLGGINTPKMYLTLEERIEMLARLKPDKIPVSEANKLLDKEDRLYRKNYNEVCENESVIRLYQVQDILLFLIAREFLPKELSESADNYKLHNIKGILNTPTNFSVRVNNITINADNVKIRDYGKVFSIRYDSRFVSLSKVLDKIKPGRKNISYDSYKMECEAYEHCRVNIVPLCHLFEKIMVETFNDLEKESEGYYNFTKLVETYKERTNQINDIDTIFLKSVRNMFMHDVYKEECINNVLEDLGYAKVIEELFIEKMNSIVSFQR